MNAVLIFPGICLVIASSTLEGYASFDDYEEGFHGHVLVDGGITFFGVDEHLPSPGGTFAIDDIRSTASGFPEWATLFSPPNTLAMTAFTSGPRGGGARFGELRMTTGRVENFARVDVLHFDTFLEAGNSIVLEAYLEGLLVGKDAVFLSDANGVARADQLTIDGIEFDVLRLAATGPGDRPYFVGSIDNVRITPEPSSAAILLCALSALAQSGSRKPKGERRNAIEP